MKKLPENLLQSLKEVEGFNEECFVKVHESGEQVTSIRINPNKFSIDNFQFSIENQIPWSQYGFYLKERPSFTFDPLFHAGCYYVQEASSMFLEQALKQLTDLSKSIKVLDVCASPGGKSTHIQSLISSESLLVSNEIIKSRNRILIDNMIKWGSKNVVVTNNDPSAFQKLEGYFDVVVVDAPCSGSGLFRKNEEAIDEWSLHNVQMCSRRQQKILADVLAALKENGVLIYSTCSYSKEEDEDISDWLVEEMEMKNEKLKIKNDWNIVETSSSKTNCKGYRFYPDKIKGEGFFLSCFRKTQSANEKKIRPVHHEKASVTDKQIIQPWLNNDAFEIFKDRHLLFAIPHSFVNDYTALKALLNVQYAGVHIGQIIKNKLIPDHALALSTILSEKISVLEISNGQAIKYLQRQELCSDVSVKGWNLIRYLNYNLGWVNVLPHRINNYYPKELRILKRQNDSAFKKL